MGVVIARVDSRLIHGQVLEAWVPHLRADMILVVGSRESRDPFQRALLEALGSPRLRIRVVSPEEAASVAEREGPGHRILLLFPGVEQAFRAFEQGLRFDRLNLGNVHPREGSHPVTRSVFLTPEDEQELLALARQGVEIEARAVPADRSPDVVGLIRAEGRA